MTEPSLNAVNDPTTNGAAKQSDRDPGHRSDELLRRSEARYRALVEATSQTVWSWSPDGANSDCERVQRWWQEVTGQTPEEQRGGRTAWLEVVHPDDREAAGAAWAAALATGTAYDAEYRVRGRSGGWRYIKARGIPVSGPDGSTCEWVGILNDVTEQRRAVADVVRVTVESERRRRMYETALSHTADFVYLIDPEGRFTYVNKALLDLWRKNLSDAVGKTFFELDYPPDLAARLLRQIREVVATRQPLRDDAPFTSADGTRAYEYTLVPVLGADGGVEAVAGSTRDITDRNKTELALRASEERYRALVTASADVVYRMSADWVEMYPLDGRDLVPSNAEPIRGWMQKNLPAFEHARVTEAIDRAVAAKGPFEMVHRVFRPDRTLGWTYSRAAPILDDRGSIVEWFGTARNVTDQKSSGEELARLAEALGLAVAAADLGTWEWDPATDATTLSARAAEVYGVDPAVTHPREALRATLHPDDRARARAAAQAAVADRADYDIEYRLTRPGDEPVWVAVRGRGVYDAAGTLTRMNGVVQDITARKRAEAALNRVTAESERRKRLYEAALNNTPDLVYVFDPDHRFAYANDALLKTWGKTWDEAIGKTCRELGYEDGHAARHDREIEQVRATGLPIRGEVPFTGTGGRRVHDYIFVPVFGATGEVEAVAGTTRDITDRQAMEQELRDADRKKDDFIALLAHELRNPLAPIRNGLQTIRLAGADAAAAAKARAVMERQLGHMVRLIDDLLDVSRIGRNKMDLRRERVALTDVMSSAVETARPLIDEAGHELTVALPAAPVVLDADLTRVAQVFSNLLTNSAKYTPQGGRIWLSAERAGGAVVVSVRDTGIGIPAASLPTIFDMFSQVDRPIERSAGGLGIGLALVKGLVEMHGGTVTAGSPGQGLGSTFTVTLPTVTEWSAPPEPVPADTPTRPGIGRRILVVDDNRDGAESLAEVLALLGNEVRSAHDGLEAVERAEQFRPEVILMDVGMPKLNGLEATKRIRERPWGTGVTIIALTGWGQENDRERSRAAGCDGHLVKPVKLTDLQQLLAKLTG